MIVSVNAVRGIDDLVVHGLMSRPWSDGDYTNLRLPLYGYSAAQGEFRPVIDASVCMVRGCSKI